MNRVAPAERGGASALAHLAIFSGQAVAAVAAGAAVVAFGYSGLTAAAAALAVASGILLRRLPGEQSGDQVGD